MNEISVVETTSDDPDFLEMLATSLIESNLAACVQIFADQVSLYRWEGKVARSSEKKLQAKTTTALAEFVADFIKRQHHYDLPEIAISLLVVTDEFANWVAEETTALDNRE